MAYIDVFISERGQRELYGVSDKNAEKVLILTYLLLRALDLDVRHKLLALYSKYNRGTHISQTGAGFVVTPVPGSQQFISQTISKVIKIAAADLPSGGTIEDQIVAFINNNSYTKGAEDAELWIEVE